MSSRRPDVRPSIVVGVTTGISAASLLRGQLAWFKDAGWEVTLVSTPDELAQKTSVKQDVPLIGIPMRRRISPLTDIVALLRWTRLLAVLRPDATNVGTPKAALLGTLAAWIVRIPRRLYVVRGLRLEGASPPLRWVLWLTEALTMWCATDVLFVSNSLADEAKRRWLLPRRKSWLIGAGSSNGIDALAVAKRVSEVDGPALRANLNLAPTAFVVGFVGRINRDKGVDLILDAFRSPNLRSDFQALLIGPTEDYDLGDQIDAFNDRIKRVTWTDDVWGHLPAIDVLCLPTRREGFPNVVLEAAAAGVPAIVTSATGAVDSVVPGVTGLLLANRSADTLIEALNGLANDPHLLRKLGAAAKKRAIEEYVPQQVWIGMEEILMGVSSPVRARYYAEAPQVSGE